MTGRPSIASRISVKSSCWTLRSSSSASASCSAVLARIIRRTTGRRSGARNMCSVRHSPMPSAPRRRALAASSPVSALARTPSLRRLFLPPRTASAHSRMVANSVGGSAAASAISPSTTSPVEPSSEIDSPSATVTPLAVNDLPLILTFSAPTTAGVPQPRATTAAWLTSPPRDGQDALGHHHPVDVLGARLAAHEDDLLAPADGGLGVVGGEVHLADGGPWRRGEALGDDLPRPGELRVQHGVEVVGGHSRQRLLAGDLPALLALAGALGHVDGHLQGGRAGALADAGLEHPQLALLDGELRVAHVLVVPLEAGEDRQQLVVDLREVLGHVVEVLGVADAGHDVLALGVDQEVAVGLVLPGGRVAGEADAGAGVVVAVAEHHRLDVDGRAEVVADALADAVGDRPGAVPAAEHGLHGPAQLLHRVLREGLAGGLLDDRLVLRAEVLQRGGRDLGVVGDAGGRLGLLERVLEPGAVDVQHDASVHRDEPPVGVVGEAVVGACGEPLDAAVVETEVQDGVHHAGHRELGAGTDADEQRVAGVTEPAAHLLLQRGDLGGDLLVEAGRPTTVHVGAAGIGGDREAGRHRQLEHAGHLGQVGALATEQVLVLHRRPAVLVIERVHVLRS